MPTTVVLWLFLSVVCAARGHQPIEQAKQATDLSADSSDDKLLLVTSANKGFAFNLYRKLVAHASSKGQNIFFSPVSVSAALAALSVGARGETHQQLFRTLGFNSSQLTQSDINNAFLKIIGSMASKISQGTAVFVDSLFTPKPDFLHVLKQWYFTEGFKVDFSNPIEGVNTINQCVSRMTSGKITRLVESLDPSTVLYLLNYVYFKGIWATPFDPKLTTLDLFRVTETVEVPVPMMRMKADVDTYYDKAIATSILHLPFNNSYSMLLLLPDTMETLESKISPAHITRWLKQLKQRKYKISVPMFYMNTSYKLNDVLNEMGMADMFENHTNLSGITDGQKPVVSEVIHQATLDVDETGATAATGVGISLFSLIAPELKFNRPFIVMITEFTMLSAPVVLWILSALVCVGRSHHHIGHGEKAQDTAADDANNKISLVTSANKEFAFRLYRKLAGDAFSQGKNIFFSPLSVSTALAALSVGAQGETHQQLFRGLGFNGSQLAQTDVNQAFRTFFANTSQDIRQGTAIFVGSIFKPKPEFLDALKQSFSAEGFSVDFTKTTESADTINQYVSDKTNGKINKLVESLDPDTVMYLLSYIYFKGKWETPFDPRDTKQDVFRVEENTEVQVQMMEMEKDVNIYSDKAINTTVLHLPFNNSYSMLLLLPENMTMLENNISPAHVARWLKWLTTKTYIIYVPKFSIKTSYNLKDVLTEMGMADMFGDRADLGGITEEQKLAVSEVVHQATLDVDETGATAAAATGIGFIPLSFHYVPELKFNRPFMVVITDRTTENMLFMGKIVNPNI
ncbi:uncharacterized protein LOC106934436 [Poecilia latipinna]|uniref:Thyroxine-binding globulin n=1 Tax=Poecilia latipinna TaxID=48699 RepID=A0A3B3TZT3_9TELE|nr:PREDICTED: uncharacterized protein LOC106934436 [Poecilia latipinna]